MAIEIPGQIISMVATTGLSASRFVKADASGYAAYPALGAPIDGVLQESSTGSTTKYAKPVVISGVVKVEAPSSTIAVGDLVAASSVGKAVASTAGAYVVGRVVAGSSGGAGRLLSVLLNPIGTT